MGGFDSVQKGRTAGDRRRGLGRWGNLAPIAAPYHEVWTGKPMHHAAAVSSVHSFD